MTNAVLTLLVQDVLMDSNIAFMYSKNQAPSQWLASSLVTFAPFLEFPPFLPPCQ